MKTSQVWSMALVFLLGLSALGCDPEEPDTTAPVIALLGDNPMVLTLGTAYVEPGVRADDDVDGDISGAVVVAGTVNVGVVGTYVLTYSVSDAAGNAAAPIVRTVSVEAAGAVSEVIGAAGGAVDRSGVGVIVPANALAGDVSVSLERGTVPAGTVLPVSVGDVLDSTVFEVSGLGGLLQGGSVDVTLDYPDVDQNGVVDGTAIDELALLVLAIVPVSGVATVLPGVVDPLANTVTFEAGAGLFAAAVKGNGSMLFALAGPRDSGGAVLMVSESQLDFAGMASGGRLTFDVWNAGAAGSTLTFDVTSDVAWALVAYNASGTSTGVDDKLTVYVDLSRIALQAKATRQGTITVSSNAGLQAVPVTVLVSLAASTDLLDFGTTNGPLPLDIWNSEMLGEELTIQTYTNFEWILLDWTMSASTGPDDKVHFDVAIDRSKITGPYPVEGSILSTTIYGDRLTIAVRVESLDIHVSALKGYVTGANVLCKGAELGVTSSQPGALGTLVVSADDVSQYDIVTVQGGVNSRDSLDATLDADDPSFEGRYLRRVYDDGPGFIVTPVSTLVAKKFEENVAAVANVDLYWALREAAEDVGDAFLPTLDNWWREDMMAAGAEQIRLEQERVWAILEFAMAAGITLDEAIDVLSSHLDGRWVSGRTRFLLEALNDSAVGGSNLDYTLDHLEAELDRLFFQQEDAPLLTHAHLATSQMRLRAALDALADEGEMLSVFNARDVVAASSANAPTAYFGVGAVQAINNVPLALDASGSWDPGGNGLTYWWEGVDGGVLSDPSAERPTFLHWMTGTYELRLWVNNGTEWSYPAKLKVAVSAPEPPQAHAPHDFSARTNTPVCINGAGSTSPDGLPLSYLWTLTSSPVGSTPVLTQAATACAYLLGDVEGVYELRLEASNGYQSDTDDVAVTLDYDGDGILSAEDDDRDGDGYLNGEDAYPDNPIEFADSSGNGQGNYATQDEDGDGTADIVDALPFDGTQTTLPVTSEAEPNDSSGSATLVAAGIPFSVTGDMLPASNEQPTGDVDYFQFATTASTSVTATLNSTGNTFSPVLAFHFANGGGFENEHLWVSPNSGLDAAITATLPAGVFLISVTDAGGAGLSYQVDVFIDTDRDTISDDRELALGINSRHPDTDLDGIYDAAELYASVVKSWAVDVDGDGIPNWFDRYSDGDGIPDRLEGSADIDGDGLGNHVDTDSDGNGILDADEAGPFVEVPVDSDVDGIADYRDLDDDGDGVLDVLDDDRLVPVPNSNVLDPDPANRILIDSVTVDWGGHVLTGMAHIGDTVLLRGSGFTSPAASNVVVFSGGVVAANAFPFSGSATELSVVVPEAAAAATEVSVVNGNLRSNIAGLQIIGLEQPVLFEPDSTTGQPGDLLGLFGLGFDDPGGITVSFAGAQAVPSLVQATYLEVTIPAGAKTGDLDVATAVGVSNALHFRIESQVTCQIVLPTGAGVAMTSLIVAQDVFRETSPNASGQAAIDVNSSGMGTIDVFLPASGDDPLALYLQAVTVPGDAHVVVDSLSTAVSMMMLGLYADRQVGPESLDDLRDLIAGVPEVFALAAIIEAGLGANPYLLTEGHVTFLSQIFDAYFSTQDAIDSALNAGLFSKETPYTQPNQAGTDGSKGPYDATITPPSEQHGINVLVLAEGNLGIYNDTKLPLSVSFITKRAGASVLQHIQSAYLDTNIVGAQGWTTLANTKTDFGQPKYKSCTVVVLTPATGGKEHSARQYLQTRVAIDSFILPLINEVVGVTVDGEDMLKMVLSAAPNALDSFFTSASNDDVVGAFRGVFEAVLYDKSAQKLFIKALVEHLGKGAAEEVILKMTARVSAKLVPVVGWISANIEAIDMGLTVMDLSLVIYDMAYVPPELTWDVEWPDPIHTVQPSKEPLMRIPVDQKLFVLGKELGPITMGTIFTTTYEPRILVYDAGIYDNPCLQSVAWTETTLLSYSQDGTLVSVMLPASFMAAVTGPIGVGILHHPIQPPPCNSVSSSWGSQWDGTLGVAKPQITNIIPSSIKWQDTVTLVGEAFWPGHVQVRFPGDTSYYGLSEPPEILSVSYKEIRVTVPKHIEQGNVWLGDDNGAASYSAHSYTVSEYTATVFVRAKSGQGVAQISLDGQPQATVSEENPEFMLDLPGQPCKEYRVAYELLEESLGTLSIEYQIINPGSTQKKSWAHIYLEHPGMAPEGSGGEWVIQLGERDDCP